MHIQDRHTITIERDVLDLPKVKTGHLNPKTYCILVYKSRDLFPNYLSEHKGNPQG